MADYRSEEDSWFVIGVAWFGDKTEFCKSSGKPNLYARVRNYSDWIYNQTGIPPVPRPSTTTTPTTTTTTTTTTSTTTKPQSTTTRDPCGYDCTYVLSHVTEFLCGFFMKNLFYFVAEVWTMAVILIPVRRAQNFSTTAPTR